MNAQWDIDRLRERVQRCRGRFDDLALASGMSKSWLSKFANGRFQSPRIRTVYNLDMALRQIEREASR